MPEPQGVDSSGTPALVARFIVLAAGGLYGATLTGGAVVACGGGHGTYIVLGIVSAPLGFLSIWSAFVFAPLLWASLFFVASASAKHSRFMATAALLTHYVAAAVLITRSEFGDWTHFQKVYRSAPGIIVEPLAIYVAGQLCLWLIIACTALRWQRLMMRFSVPSAMSAILMFALALWSGFAGDIFGYVWWYAEVIGHFE